MANISFYGSHNAAYVVEDKGEVLFVLEVERLLNYKNSGMAQYQCPKYEDILFLAGYIPKFIMSKLGISEFETCYFMNCDVLIDKQYGLQNYVKAKNYVYCQHHESHAAGVFYQSPYKEAIIFSFDGGGNDGFFNIYHCSRGESPKLLDSLLNPYENSPHVFYDLGFPYMVFGDYLGDIKKEAGLNIGNLVYSGKIMGLASYGKVIEEWLPHFIDFYKKGPNGAHIGPWDDTGYYDYEKKINELGDNIGVKFDKNNRLKDQLAYDIAATSQRAFEECFLEVAKPYFEKYPDLPVCIAGGCGLNIILNTRLVKEFNKQVFVGPNPNDCGIALGMILNVLKPENPFDATYSGLELLDLDSLPHYIQDSYKTFTRYYDKEVMSEDLISGKIIGVARGRSEHGPRALGNRSILCNPSIENMKDILNKKVKHREWYRPFAPVVRLEDVSKYFEWEGDSRWMSFCPLVKEEWRNKLSAITHVDGTARVQTVTREENEWLYDLLTEIDAKTGIGVLLNTSFNVDGSPILSTVKDAFTILEKTELDGILIEDYYILKTNKV